MHDYIDELVHEAPADLMKGTSATPATNHLFAVNPDCPKLNEVDACISPLDYKTVVSVKENLSRSAVSDIVPQCPDTDDWKNLGRCLHYLLATKHLLFVLSTDDTGIIWWWVDASFAVHPNMRSHLMSIGTSVPMPGKIRECVAENDGSVMSVPMVTSSVLETSQSNVLSNVILLDTLWVEVVQGQRKHSKSIKNINSVNRGSATICSLCLPSPT
jgi:hypothetical protein